MIASPFPASPEDIFRSRFMSGLPQVLLTPRHHPVADFEPEPTIEPFFVFVDHGDLIGEIDLDHALSPDGRSVSFIHHVLRYDYRGQDRAPKKAMVAAYLSLAAYSELRGETMVSGEKLSDHSLRIWKLLSKVGVASIIEPFTASGEVHEEYGAWHVGHATMIHSSKIVSSPMLEPTY